MHTRQVNFYFRYRLRNFLNNLNLILRSFVRHALFLSIKMPWSQSITQIKCGLVGFILQASRWDFHEESFLLLIFFLCFVSDLINSYLTAILPTKLRCYRRSYRIWKRIVSNLLTVCLYPYGDNQLRPKSHQSIPEST